MILFGNDVSKAAGMPPSPEERAEATAVYTCEDPSLWMHR